MRWLRAALVLAAIALAALPGRASDDAPAARFPLHVGEGGRYLADATGRPFLVNGDTAWSLIAQLTREEAEAYLADRKRRGFNALLVNLVEHQFAARAPANAYGDAPFARGKPFGALERAYFDHAAWVLKRAEELGFVVFLAPAYLGANGGGQGWFLEASAAGDATLRRYGEAVARRFADRRNIVWVHGGDFDAPDKALVRAVVSGIKTVSPGSLHTVHSTRDTVTRDYWAGEPWLSLDTAYTYGDAHAATLAQTERRPPIPVVLIEGLYEGEHGTDARKLRMQAYGALLAGAAGHFFGNNPIWNFGGRALYAAGQGWREALDSAGSRSMSHLAAMFDGLPWWRMSPGKPLAGIALGGDVYWISDGRSGIGYMPDGGQPSAALRLSGWSGEVAWIDPAGGRRYPPEAIVAERRGEVRPPAAANAAGDPDWVFVLRSAD